MNGGKQQNRLPQRTIESAGLREKKNPPAGPSQ